MLNYSAVLDRSYLKMAGFKFFSLIAFLFIVEAIVPHEDNVYNHFSHAHTIFFAMGDSIDTQSSFSVEHFYTLMKFSNPSVSLASNVSNNVEMLAKQRRRPFSSLQVDSSDVTQLLLHLDLSCCGNLLCKSVIEQELHVSLDHYIPHHTFLVTIIGKLFLGLNLMFLIHQYACVFVLLNYYICTTSYIPCHEGVYCC